VFETARIDQVIRCRVSSVEAAVKCQATPWGIFGGRSGTGTGFAPGAAVSPVSIIPTVFHAHSVVYR
jgi:hypothetical protein